MYAKLAKRTNALQTDQRFAGLEHRNPESSNQRTTKQRNQHLRMTLA